MPAPGVTIARQDAQILAAKGLIFIANDQEVLGRFMNLTGLAPDDFRGAAGEPEFLAGVLSFLMDHEAVLMALPPPPEFAAPCRRCSSRFVGRAGLGQLITFAVHQNEQ